MIEWEQSEQLHAVRSIHLAVVRAYVQQDCDRWFWAVTYTLPDLMCSEQVQPLHEASGFASTLQEAKVQVCIILEKVRCEVLAQQQAHLRNHIAKFSINNEG